VSNPGKHVCVDEINRSLFQEMPTELKPESLSPEAFHKIDYEELKALLKMGEDTAGGA